MSSCWIRPSSGSLLRPAGAVHDLDLPVAVRQTIDDRGGQLGALYVGKPVRRFGPNPSQATRYPFVAAATTAATRAAASIAHWLGRMLWRVPLAALLSKYTGETEKNLARVSERAARMDVVLLFDEADALFGKRSAVASAGDRYANIEVAYLSQRAEQYRGLVILSTNLRPHLDQRTRRHLEAVVDFTPATPTDA